MVTSFMFYVVGGNRGLSGTLLVTSLHIELAARWSPGRNVLVLI